MRFISSFEKHGHSYEFHHKSEAVVDDTEYHVLGWLNCSSFIKWMPLLGHTVMSVEALCFSLCSVLLSMVAVMKNAVLQDWIVYFFLSNCFHTSTPGIIEHYMDVLRSWSWWSKVNSYTIQAEIGQKKNGKVQNYSPCVGVPMAFTWML